MSYIDSKNCSEHLMTNRMGLDRAPVEFQKLGFLRTPYIAYCTLYIANCTFLCISTPLSALFCILCYFITIVRSVPSSYGRHFFQGDPWEFILKAINFEKNLPALYLQYLGYIFALYMQQLLLGGSLKCVSTFKFQRFFRFFNPIFKLSPRRRT